MSTDYLVLNLFVSNCIYYLGITHFFVITVDYNFPILSVFQFPFNFPTVV